MVDEVALAGFVFGVPFEDVELCRGSACVGLWLWNVVGGYVEGMERMFSVREGRRLDGVGERMVFARQSCHWRR